MAIPLPCPDGELLAAIQRGRVSTADELAAIEQHLAECPQCRAVADLLAGFDEPLLPDLDQAGSALTDVMPADVTSPDVTLPDVTSPDVTSPDVTSPDVTLATDADAAPQEESAAADPHDPLLAAIRFGDADAWQQLVSEYHGRLLAFARKQLGQESDAEDAVQETFVGLLKSLAKFRGDASLETWLFQILRRRISDQFRRQGSRREVTLVAGADAGAPVAIVDLNRPAAQLPSWYVRRDEQAEADQQTLAAAVADVTDQLKRQQKFRDLIVFDLLFFAGRRNCEIAELVQLEETAVAVLKHRFLRRVADGVEKLSDVAADDPSDGLSDALLSRVWESTRPTCPKRSTLGKFVLGTLADEWDRYVAFHTGELGCRFCVANLDDLTNELNSADASTESARHRILDSTVGFLPGRES